MCEFPHLIHGWLPNSFMKAPSNQRDKSAAVRKLCSRMRFRDGSALESRIAQHRDSPSLGPPPSFAAASTRGSASSASRSSSRSGSAAWRRSSLPAAWRLRGCAPSTCPSTSTSGSSSSSWPSPRSFPASRRSPSSACAFHIMPQRLGSIQPVEKDLSYSFVLRAIDLPLTFSRSYSTEQGRQTIAYRVRRQVSNNLL